MARRTSTKHRTVPDGGTLSTPDQFTLPTRDEAVAHAITYARQQHVRGWFDNGDHTIVLLSTFREEEEIESAGSL
jgi:hypothetical protein